MKMKRIFALVLMAIMLCLPVLSMAECPFIVKDAAGKEVTPVVNVADPEGFAASWDDNDSQLHILQSGLTVSNRVPGQDSGASIVSWIEGELTLENVTISGLNPQYSPSAISSNSTPLTLIFKGDNSLTSTQFGILYLGNINIQMVENSKLTINAQEPIGDITNATQPSEVVSVSATDIASGSGTIIINGEMVYQYPKPASNDLPQTGDNSNVILWSALACISVIGMTMLVRKRKEA